MFFREISDFEENFKFLDRLNVLLFNVWKDKNAEAYKTNSMDQLEMFYRNYVNEMRQKSSLMSSLMKQITEDVYELRRVQDQISSMSNNPDIQGCTLCRAEGSSIDGKKYREFFIFKHGENSNQLKNIAITRCRDLVNIDKATLEEPL